MRRASLQIYEAELPWRGLFVFRTRTRQDLRPQPFVPYLGSCITQLLHRPPPQPRCARCAMAEAQYGVPPPPSPSDEPGPDDLERSSPPPVDEPGPDELEVPVLPVSQSAGAHHPGRAAEEMQQTGVGAPEMDFPNRART